MNLREAFVELKEHGYVILESETIDYENQEWHPVTKIEYDINVYVPEAGTKVHNFLENSDYVTDEKKPYVLVGTVGEEWTVDAKKLMKAYKYNGKAITEDVLPELSDGEKHVITAIAGAEKMWVIQTDKVVDVKTSWGETLTANRAGIKHGKGDYIICSDKGNAPNLDDMWVINGLIFPNTYKMI